VGEHRLVWRLDRVSAAEITFKRLSEYEYGQEDKFFDVAGYIDRVTGNFSYRTDLVSGPATGQCQPATAPKF
jgi:hypothetical protein